MPRRALITGISGQDGTYLAELLAGHDYEIWGMVRSFDEALPPALQPLAGALTMRQADLLDPSSLRALVEEAAPDELYHLAAPTFVPASWEDPTETVAAIAGATGTLLSAVAGTSTRIFVAASSEVFGDPGQSPQSERSPMRPRSPYGVAKLAALGLVRTMREHHGLFASAGILFNHESPRRPAHFLPRKVTRGAAAIAQGRQETLELGSLDAVRDWSHAADVMRGAWLTLQADEPGDFVFASGEGRTIRNLVEAAFAAAGVSPEGRIVVNPEFVRPAEPVPSVGDPSRARELLGWRPERSFEALIAEMVRADLAELSS